MKQAAIHSAIYTVLFVPLSVAGGLLTAVALNRKIRGIRWYRTAVFVPVVVSTIATAIVFLWVFDPHFGLANWLWRRWDSARSGSSRARTARCTPWWG